ncbi:PAS-domain containing protein [Sphingomonas sp. BN140010]|uniref:histidine kinase n=1 Tax=Sphingomonas arvum TaxID=2992113 RepID=A0ABT3JDA3_9SPHN|nr:PAS domain-containing sensor histidine kinase [Sphingomonas sp. BN140010]MCW3797053.1 PAS-domain containing protein [Sphingomonas sp. BN140010]
MTGVVETSWAGLLPLALAAVWLPLAACLSVIAARRMRRARSVLQSARSMAALLAAAPARPLLVMRDGAIDADAAFLREVGLEDGVGHLQQLAAGGRGLDGEDLAALAEELRSAVLTGARVSRSVRIANSDRVMEVRGGPAPPPSPAGAVLLWFFDTSSAEQEKVELARRLKDTGAALDALTHLIEAAPFPMWYRGADLNLGLVNNAFVTAVEAPSAAAVIKDGIELIDGPGSKGAKAAAQRALADDRPFSRNQPATIGGERRMLRLVDVPLGGGAVAGFAIDIQDLEDARFELGRYIEGQRELADRMTAGAVQFDPDRTLSFFNRPFAIMAQLDPEWLGEKPEFDRVLERMREQGRLPETRDFPQWKAERRGWFTSPAEALEEEWILTNGDHLRVVGQPLPDGGLRLFFEDRTEQVRLASARDTLLRVRTATFDNLFEGIGVFAADGRLYLWNRRFCSFWDLDESWLGEHPRVDELVPAMAQRLVNPTAAAQLRELVRSATNERRQGSGRLSMVDGSHFEFASVPLPDGNALFTMVDVTDSTRIEYALRERTTALEEADRVRTDFVANMSYELRTPLTSIGGFAQMLAGGYAGKLAPAAADYVGAILESVARLSKLIDDVLDLTQGEQRAVTIEHERIDLAGLVRNTVERMEAAAREKGLALNATIDPSTGVVIGDARRLRESIEHVLRNAIAYTDEGTVTLHATGDDQQVQIRLSDTGEGIDGDDQRRVFERFTRIGGTHGEAALGLGLPLTRQFVEAHGGTVDLQSRKGEGTVVTITLPRRS